MSVHELAQRARDRMDLEQLKMPIGFIRIVELVLSNFWRHYQIMTDF